MWYSKEMFTWDRNHEQEMEQYVEDVVNTEPVTIEWLRKQWFDIVTIEDLMKFSSLWNHW